MIPLVLSVLLYIWIAAEFAWRKGDPYMALVYVGYSVSQLAFIWKWTSY